MSEKPITQKQAILTSVGVRIEDMLEGAKNSKSGYNGAKGALRAVAEKVASLSSSAEKELDDGTLRDLKELQSIKKYISACTLCVSNYANHVESLEVSAIGSIGFGTKAVALLKKLVDDEQAKQDSIRKFEKEGGRRPVGSRPEVSEMQQRRAETTKEKNKAAKKSKDK